MPQPLTIADRIEKFGSVRADRETRYVVPSFDVPEWTRDASCATTANRDKFVPNRPTAPPTECRRCPVTAQCLKRGKDTRSQGWWGGIYLTGKETT